MSSSVIHHVTVMGAVAAQSSPFSSLKRLRGPQNDKLDRMSKLSVSLFNLFEIFFFFELKPTENYMGFVFTEF